MTSNHPLVVHANSLDPITSDLEAVHRLLAETFADLPGEGDDLEVRNAFESRMYYLIDRLGDHVAALRQLTEPQVEENRLDVLCALVKTTNAQLERLLVQEAEPQEDEDKP